MKVAAENLGVARFISDDPFTMLKMQRYGTSFNLDGIWGGNMYAGGAGAILPNKITSKHNFRYVPNMNGLDIVKKLRAQLDSNGYKDVEVKVIGDVPWAKMSYDTDIAPRDEADLRPVQHPARRAGATCRRSSAATGRRICSRTRKSARRVAPVSMPIGMGGAGHGGNAHAANEYYVIEGAGRSTAWPARRKSHAAIFYNFAGKNGSAAAAPRKTE